jgi:hypothetical protein
MDSISDSPACVTQSGRDSEDEEKQFIIALLGSVVQWIVFQIPILKMQVRFLPGLLFLFIALPTKKIKKSKLAYRMIQFADLKNTMQEKIGTRKLLFPGGLFTQKCIRIIVQHELAKNI